MTDGFRNIVGIILHFIIGIIRDPTMMTISYFIGVDEFSLCNDFT